MKVDEWGAVIKNQNEAFRRMEENQQRHKAEFMHKYGKELESEVYNKIRKNKDSETAQKNIELELALQKRAELDQINAMNLDKKKQMQNILAKEYEENMRIKQQMKQNDRMNDLRNGQMANEKAAQELNFLNESEKNKKKMVKEILNNAKNVHDGVRNMSEKDRYASTLEDKRHLEEVEQRNKQRDLAMLSKFNQFNDFQKKNAISYNKNVISPQIQKDVKFKQALRKQEEDIKRRADKEEDQRNKQRKDWAMQTRFGQEKQMKDKNDDNLAKVALHQYDERNTKAIEQGLYGLKNEEFLEKKVRQQKYKEMLDNQKKTKDHMRMYGNMTGIEKQFNKNDLSAFKNYDNNTYALIPGLNSTSVQPSDKVMKDKTNKRTQRTYNEEIERMNQFGLTRDVTLMKNPALIATNAHRSSMDDITGHVNKFKTDSGTLNNSVRSPGHTRTITSPQPMKPVGMPGTAPNLNFNNHHLYQAYNPISGVYSPEKQNMNQARTTFRYAAARNLAPQ